MPDYIPHPLIRGLFEALPEPETRWTAEDRVKWLRAAASCFDLLYPGGDVGRITVVEAKLTLERSEMPEETPPCA